MLYRKYLQQLLPIDIITLGYIILTAVYIFLGAGKLDKMVILLSYRLVLIFIIGSLIYLNSISDKKSVRFLRHFYPLMFLLYFYPETDYINNFLFNNLDPLVANLEVTIFGGHPSIWFSQVFPWRWFSELMNIGYFSYFPLIFVFCYIIYKKNYENFSYVIFVICMSFYMYYIIFILFPVAGPQFFLTPPDNQIADGYVFSAVMKYVQSVGEHPTGAFPSSHVGIITLVLILVYKLRPKLLKWYIPFAILLYLSTVYIKAHYVIDVIAGLLSVPTIYWISSQTHYLLSHGLAQENILVVKFERIKTSIRYLYDGLKRK